MAKYSPSGYQIVSFKELTDEAKEQIKECLLNGKPFYFNLSNYLIQPSGIDTYVTCCVLMSIYNISLNMAGTDVHQIQAVGNDSITITGGGPSITIKAQIVYDVIANTLTVTLS